MTFTLGLLHNGKISALLDKRSDIYTLEVTGSFTYNIFNDAGNLLNNQHQILCCDKLQYVLRNVTNKPLQYCFRFLYQLLTTISYMVNLTHKIKLFPQAIIT